MAVTEAQEMPPQNRSSWTSNSEHLGNSKYREELYKAPDIYLPKDRQLLTPKKLIRISPSSGTSPTRKS